MARKEVRFCLWERSWCLFRNRLLWRILWKEAGLIPLTWQITAANDVLKACVVCRLFMILQATLFWVTIRGSEKPDHDRIYVVTSLIMRGLLIDGKETCNEFLFRAFLLTHINLFTTSLLTISLSFLRVVRTPTLSFSFERAYWYRNSDSLSTKTSHPYPFLYFSSTRSSFHFISFHLHFLSPYILSPYILSL